MYSDTTPILLICSACLSVAVRIRRLNVVITYIQGMRPEQALEALAEREGFEPSTELPLCHLSRVVT